MLFFHSCMRYGVSEANFCKGEFSTTPTTVENVQQLVA